VYSSSSVKKKKQIAGSDSNLLCVLRGEENWEMRRRWDHFSLSMSKEYVVCCFGVTICKVVISATLTWKIEDEHGNITLLADKDYFVTKF
jgi:hypothetical protein